MRKDDELIDYDEVRDLALQHRPKMIICGATAYPRLIDFARFRAIADEVSAYLMVDAAHSSAWCRGRAISRQRSRTVRRRLRHRAHEGPARPRRAW
ncbi:hypothetical protein GCM10020218_104070 [Dactylosporangium vinaceum]